MPNNPQEVEVEPVYGTTGNDIIFEVSDAMEYFGGMGNDVFVASSIDTYFPGAGYVSDHFYGGIGSDTVSYQLSQAKITANLEAGTVNRGGGGYFSTDYLHSIEDLMGTNFSDTIVGSSGANHLWGFGGNDVINGLAGNDHLSGDSGNDSLYGGDGNDVIDGGTGNDHLADNNGADTLNGGDGADILDAGAHNDVLKGGAHNDQLFGGSGDDRLEGGSGNDLLNGGTGTDTVVYGGSGAVSVNLWLGTASGAWGTDALAGIERVETGGGHDIVFGSFGGNRLTTGGGNDTVYALDGHDVVYAGSGHDTVDGYEGNDLIYAGTGNDRVHGGDDGDTIYGEDGQDLLSGDAGNDVLYGGAGSDKLRGGDGLDTINGGSGPDIIAWGQGDSGLDTIAGFNLNEDKFSFEAGYFATNAVGPLNLEDFLFVSDSGPNAILWANTAESGWTNIATLLNVDYSTLDHMIDDGSILAPPAVDLGGLLG